jgi:CBS domain-containing protein
MQVRDAMTRDVCLATPGQTIRDVAKMMAEIDAGILPVGENDRIVGMISDRDIAVRAVAAGKGPETPVRDVMSTEHIHYCFEDDDVADVAKSMGEHKVRRMPVMDRNKRLVGIISLGDVSQSEEKAAGKGLERIAEKGGPHDQSSRSSH